jgi:biopolymer transport protein ExbD
MNIRGKIKSSAIPTSSMADLAFLLLIFFFVAAVIDVDSGIGLNLPEYTEQPPDPVSQNRFAGILINAENEISLDNEAISLTWLKDELKKRIRDKNDLPKNKKLIVSLKTDRKTKYGTYIQVLDQVKRSFSESRDEYAISKYGKKFSKLDEEEQKTVKEAVPVIISIAEPEVTN